MWKLQLWIRMCLSHKVWIHFQIHSPWALGCDITVWATLWFRSSLDCCVFFLACFVPLNSQGKFVKVCNSWIRNLLSGRAESRWSEAASKCNCSYEEGCQSSKNAKILRAWWNNHSSCVQECFNWAWCLHYIWIIISCIIYVWSLHVSQILDCNVQIAILVTGNVCWSWKFCANNYFCLSAASNRSLEMSVPAAVKWCFVLPPT